MEIKIKYDTDKEAEQFNKIVGVDIIAKLMKISNNGFSISPSERYMEG